MKPIKKIFAIIAAAFLAMSFTACGEGGSTSSADTDSLETSSTEELQPQGEAIMTAGVVSDTQLEADVGPLASNYNAPAQFKRALEYYKAIDVDVLFFLGDIVNNAQQSSYDLYNSIMDEVFPDKSARPEILFNVGNHERFVGISGKPNNDKEFTDKQFTENTGEELRAHKKIKGYSFISIDTNVYDSNDCITRGSLNYLEKEAASAAEEADGKPIFVGIHPPVAGTTYGSFGNSDATAQSSQIDGILRRYPNVILFTAHCHYPLADERSIYQKEYTAVNTGSCSYCCLGAKNEEGKIANSAGIKFDNVMSDGSYRPYPNELTGANSHDQGQGLVVKAYENAVTIDRINFNTGKAFGEQWIVPAAPTTDDFIYTDKRGETDPVPEWKEGHEAEAVLDGLQIKISWKEAMTEGAPVESYVVSAVKFGTDIPLAQKCIVSDYYAALGEPGRYALKLSLTEVASKYQVKIQPYNCFGRSGEPLYIDVAGPRI